MHITADEYYGREEKLINDAEAARKKSVETQFAAIEQKTERELEYTKDPRKQQEIRQKFLEAVETRESQILQIESEAEQQRVALHLKAAEDIRKIYVDQGALGVVKKSIRDIKTEYENTAQNIYNTAKSVASSMESSFSTFLDHTSDKFLDFKNLVVDVLNSIYKAMV
jgi:hypothetical protein